MTLYSLECWKTDHHSTYRLHGRNLAGAHIHMVFSQSVPFHRILTKQKTDFNSCEIVQANFTVGRVRKFLPPSTFKMPFHIILQVECHYESSPHFFSYACTTCSVPLLQEFMYINDPHSKQDLNSLVIYLNEFCYYLNSSSFHYDCDIHPLHQFYHTVWGPILKHDPQKAIQGHDRRLGEMSHT